MVIWERKGTKSPDREPKVPTGVPTVFVSCSGERDHLTLKAQRPVRRGRCRQSGNGLLSFRSLNRPGRPRTQLREGVIMSAYRPGEGAGAYLHRLQAEAHPGESLTPKITPLHGRALKWRKELRLIFCANRKIMPIAYGRLLRVVDRVISHEEAGKTDRIFLPNGAEAGRAMGLTKEQRRELGITTMRAIDETDEERAAYVKTGRREPAFIRGRD